MACFLGRGLRNEIPNSVDRTVDFKELIRKRREEREKRVKKEGRTEEKKLVFTAAAGSAEVVIMLKSCGGQGLDTFIRTVLLAFRTSSRGILGHIISHW